MDLFYEVSYGDPARGEIAGAAGGPAAGAAIRIAARAGGWSGEIRGGAIGRLEGGALRGEAWGEGDRRIFAGCLARHARDLGVGWSGWVGGENVTGTDVMSAGGA